MCVLNCGHQNTENKRYADMIVMRDDSRGETRKMWLARWHTRTARWDSRGETHEMRLARWDLGDGDSREETCEMRLVRWDSRDETRELRRTRWDLKDGDSRDKPRELISPLFCSRYELNISYPVVVKLQKSVQEQQQKRSPGIPVTGRLQR